MRRPRLCRVPPRRILLVSWIAVWALPVHAGPSGVHTDREDARHLPLPEADGVFHFAIFGDRTGGPAEGIRVLEQAVEDTNLLDPDLVMTVGDLVQGYNAREEWLEQMEEFRGVMDGLRMPWYPVAGNHDIYWRGPDRPPGAHEEDYERHFGPLWYTFRHKNAGFVVLFTDEGDPETDRKGFSEPDVIRMSDEQIRWLEGALEKLGDADHVFVFLHHPRWVESIYSGGNWDRVHGVLARPGNVRAVFAGHIHRLRYDGAKDGIEYFSLATTGGGTPGDYPGAGWLHHMNIVTVREDDWSVATVPVGAVIDPRTYTPERQQDIRRLRGLAIHDATPLLLAPGGEGAGWHSFRVRNPVRRPIELTVIPRFDPAAWRMAPDHAHLHLEAGEERLVELVWSRPPAGLPADLEPPSVKVEPYYLDDGVRVAIPPRTHSVPIGLRSVPPGFFTEAPEGALALDGDGDCLRVQSGTFELPDGPFTLEARFRLDRITSRIGLVTKTESSEFGIFVNDGVPAFSVHLAGSYVTAKAPEPVEPGTWHHVAGVYDGEEVRLYLDGQRAARTPGSGARRRNRLPLYIGADTDGAGRPMSFVHGRVDDVRLSRGVRYRGAAAAPPRDPPPDDATVLLFPLDRDLGPFTPDRSRSGAHALRRGDARCAPYEDAQDAGATARTEATASGG